MTEPLVRPGRKDPLRKTREPLLPQGVRSRTARVPFQDVPLAEPCWPRQRFVPAPMSISANAPPGASAPSYWIAAPLSSPTSTVTSPKVLA